MIIDGYTRISVDLQEDSQENTSIENQKRIIRDFVKEHFPDAKLKVYEDRDRSGYTFSQREQYQEMRKELMSGDVRILVVKDFSRFSRRNSLGLLELETLRDAGVRIISIGDNIDYPTKDDWMLIQFKFLLNEMPVTDTSKKIKQMINNRQKNGQWICAVPYGYQLVNTKEMTYEIDPPAAEIVKEIFRLYNNGWGYKKIANYLTEQGFPTPRANEISLRESEGKTTKLKAKEDWSIVSVSTIIANDFYIGTLRQKKYTRKGINGKDVKVNEEDQIVIQNAHDPIIDAKTFAYAQDQLSRRTATNYRGEKKYATDYSGFLFCGDCGAPMFSMSRPDLAPAYTCGTYHRKGLKGCTSHHIRVDLLDKFLKKYILRVRENCDQMINELEQTLKDQPQREEQLNCTIETIETQLNDAKDQLKELYKQKMLDALGKSDSKSRIKEQIFDEIETELTKRIENLENQFTQALDLHNRIIETNRKAKTVIDVFADILDKQKLDKRDIGLIVDRIVVFEDHIEVKLKSDIDALLESEDKAVTANFPKGSKDIVLTQKSANRADKVFTVSVINNGDPLEIFTGVDGELIFKKYSPLGEMRHFSAKYAESLCKAAGISVAVCDRDTVLAASGAGTKELVEKPISSPISSFLEKRQSYVSDGGNEVTLTEGGSGRVAYLSPIITSGDVVGGIMMLRRDGEGASEPEKRMINAGALFLSGQMEI